MSDTSDNETGVTGGDEPIVLQFRSASSGKRLDEQEQPAFGTRSRCEPPEPVEYGRGDLIREQESDPRAPLTVEEADSGHQQVITPDGPLPVTNPESADEAAVYRVLYDDERLSSVEWRLPSFNYFLPVACPECGGLAWGFYHAETREIGDPNNTTSTGATAPRYHKRTVHHVEYRCNECEGEGHAPANRITSGGI